MKQFQHFLAILITIFIISLWCLPIYASWLMSNANWSMLYLPIVFITFLWGIVIYRKYFI